jgi:hypothetical protein
MEKHIDDMTIEEQLEEIRSGTAHRIVLNYLMLYGKSRAVQFEAFDRFSFSGVVQ